MSMLEIKNISKSFRDGSEENHVLSGLSLSVESGEIVAVLGPSGSGKSTFLSIAGLLLSADSGEVFIGGKEVSKLPKSKWTRYRKEHIGFIFQSHQLLPYLNSADQLTLFQDKKNVSKVDAMELLKELDVDSCKKKYPAKMSGGEKQRVAIARAFVNDPEIILADEPTASLDAKRGRVVVQMIRDEVKKRGKVAVVVTHDERILDLMDKVYRLENGRLTEISNS
ncbi:MAG: ABC transporter ATP-binding protein [Lachnospiraceae bacterium]|jgi:ABC-type antimicrobial peptide transport system, ATPase component|nr:ABC transporter ATP-binding protein [Lachnospiraceae bacterium]